MIVFSLLLDIVVGFQQTVYTVPEGESVAICVQIISPPDIGTVQVLVEVVYNPGGVSTNLTEASELAFLLPSKWHSE